jgi:hypothetical protein
MFDIGLIVWAVVVPIKFEFVLDILFVLAVC